MTDLPLSRSGSLIGWEFYEDYDRHGVSIERRWLRLGHGNRRIECSRTGLFVRLWWGEFSLLLAPGEGSS